MGGGAGFDRQIFVKPKTTAPAPPPSRSPVGSFFVLLLVAGLGAIVGYRFVKADRAASAPAIANKESAQLEQIAKRLDSIETRLNRVERRRRLPADGPSARNPKANYAGVRIESAAPPAAPVNHLAGNPKPRPQTVPTAQPAPMAAAGSAKPDKELAALRGDLSASHQEWEATVNRMGDVVGELGSQQSAIEQTNNNVSRLMESSQRSSVPFTLSRESGLKRVGPILMKLGRTDIGGQRYTLRMTLGDKSVELKDRALNEVVEFFTPRSRYPLQLVVSQINSGSVSGTLGIPKDLADKENNPQLQER